MQWCLKIPERKYLAISSITLLVISSKALQNFSYACRVIDFFGIYLNQIEYID